jgi:hypothetical protein
MPLVLAACTAIAAAQDDRAVKAAKFDGAAHLRPVLVVQNSIAVLRACPGADYSLFAGLRSSSDAAGRIRPLVVLGCGRIGADGVVKLALADADSTKMKATDMVLQAAVRADGESLKHSVVVSPAGIGGGAVLGPNTVGAPRFERSSTSANGSEQGGSVGPATIGAPRFWRS